MEPIPPFPSLRIPSPPPLASPMSLAPSLPTHLRQHPLPRRGSPLSLELRPCLLCHAHVHETRIQKSESQEPQPSVKRPALYSDHPRRPQEKHNTHKRFTRVHHPGTRRRLAITPKKACWLRRKTCSLTRWHACPTAPSPAHPHAARGSDPYETRIKVDGRRLPALQTSFCSA